jgi:hypothetical protein
MTDNDRPTPATDTTTSSITGTGGNTRTGTTTGKTDQALALRDVTFFGSHELQAVVTDSGTRLVPVGRSDTDPMFIDVITAGGPDVLPEATKVTVLPDQEQAQLLRLCLATVLRQLRHLTLDHDLQSAAHERTLADIRQYAIDQHLAEAICRKGLNGFLETFDMPIYQPRTRISYTITGTYDVSDDAADAAENDAWNYLKVDLSDLDNVVDDSDTFTIDIIDVETLDTETLD